RRHHRLLPYPPAGIRPRCPRRDPIIHPSIRDCLPQDRLAAGGGGRSGRVGEWKIGMVRPFHSSALPLSHSPTLPLLRSSIPPLCPHAESTQELAAFRADWSPAVLEPERRA